MSLPATLRPDLIDQPPEDTVEIELLREQLAALWDLLDTIGATVRRTNLQPLPAAAILALCHRETHRVTALIEGIEAGWLPPRLRPGDRSWP